MTSKEKVGNAPDVDAAEPACFPQGDRYLPTNATILLSRCVFRQRPACFKDAGPATSPLRRSVARCAEAHRLAKRRTGRFLVWDLRPGVNDVTGRLLGAGIEPATTELKIRSSTRLSYPVVTCRIRTGDLRLAPLLSL